MNPGASSTSTARAVRGLSAVALGAALVLQGCATSQNRDPLESFNRKMFRFNEVLDDNILRPVATGYDAITPQPVQTGIDNFVNNIKDVWSAVNLVLQGRPGQAAQTVLRVGLNTTLGVAGFIDIATPMQIDRPNEDLGQTFGVWGAPAGAYMVLPFFGPSTVRDTVALPADQYFSAARLFREPADANAVRVLTVVNKRALVLGASNLLGDVSFDKYAFVRDAFLQRRQNLIYDGEPPEELYDNGDDDAYESDVGPEASPEAVSQPQSLLQPAVLPPAVIWQHELQVPYELNASLQAQPHILAAVATWSAQGVSDLAGELPTDEELAGLREHAEPR